MEAQGEETTEVNEKAVPEKQCDEAGYPCLRETGGHVDTE